MKIYVLPVQSVFRPYSQPFLYPAHNADYGVEQDFDLYLQRNPDLITSNPALADWHYLPVYWTRYHLNHNFGQTGRQELQAELSRVVLDDTKTFSLCQYDWGPLIDTGRIQFFFSSRITDSGVDMPLLCTPHYSPPQLPAKIWIASFAGNLNNHPMRREMAYALQGRSDVAIADGNYGTAAYIKLVLESHIVLCPRGNGGSSYRFYEAMQLSSVPLLIGDRDTRPFKRFINWDAASFYTNNPGELGSMLDSIRYRDLWGMGQRAYQLWRDELDFGKWCRYVLMELELLT